VEHQIYNKLNIFLLCFILALSSLVAYEPMRKNDFVDYDDEKSDLSRMGLIKSRG